MILSKNAPVVPGLRPDVLESVTRAYLECAEWADKTEGTNPRYPKESRDVARALCAEFIRACGPLFELALCMPGYELQQFGHDIWLTRSGHGSGFWDRPELETEIGAPFVWFDRNGKPRELSADCEIGRALTCIAYGDDSGISRFAYPNLTQYRGWMYFTDYFGE